MTKKENLTAGIADPYWYEWSVGLLYALDLLYPDSGIKSITLQASNLQGLDDVVVNFQSGEAECIQIKHTRENDSLTFSDMIRKKDDNDKKGSYLHQFSSDWQKASKDFKKCNAVLFTNRNMGVKKYNVKESGSVSYERPALEIFWPYIKDRIKKASKLEEICVKKEWETAWKEWLDELNDLDNVQKLDFLKSFDIKATQEDLDEIINLIGEKLSLYFKVDARVAVQLHKSLCFALMKWTTTLRKKEEITKEDLLEALSLSTDSFKGVHDIPTTEPFLESRADFCGKLEEVLKKREYPVVFLSGEPGSGKTNIVSYLTNKIDSVITLRFYAFKPLSSDDLFLSADKGVSDPRALWGDLLIQLRELFKGKLAKYQVPISNELLTTTDELRNEVLRLSAALAHETSNTTVICIDGIDHAARAGGENTFLETLIPPEGVPKGVCFLIAGQPIHEYRSYPDWLSDEKVLKRMVPEIEEQDIRQLYRELDTKIPDEHSEIAIKIINENARGNTLSVIFAMCEAKRCCNIDELEGCLNNKKLSSGINAYYEYIWKSALENIPSSFFYVDGVVAGVLSLINKKIKPEIIFDIYGDPSINENAWKRILQKLYPVVIEEDGTFRVFHNDVRIYLERYLRKNITTFTEVASKIADYFLNKSTDTITKHELVFELLKYAGRTNDYVEVYTTEYVIEALNISRPMNELIEQLEVTLGSLIDIEDYKKIIRFSCAVSTLYQFMQSLQWADRVYTADIQIPTVLFSEKKVMHRKLLTIDALLLMLGDVELLIEHGKIDRARYVLDKWLSNLSPEEIIEILIENHQLHDEIKDEGINDRFQRILEEWGMFCQYTGINFGTFLEREENPGYYKDARAYFAKGWLAEGRNFTKNEEVMQTVEALSYYFKEDLEAFIVALMEDNNDDMVMKLTNEYKQHNFSSTFEIKLATWAITRSLEAEYKELIDNIVVKEFSYIEDSYNFSDRENFPNHALISLILSFRNSSFEKIVESFLKTYRQGDFKKEGRRYHAVHCLLSVSSHLGYMHKCINENQLNEKISIEDFKKNVRFLLSESNLIGRYEIGGNEIESYLLTQYIVVTKKIGSEFSNALQGLLIERAVNFKNIRQIDIYWSFLRELGEIKILEDLFDYWMSENGIVWEQEIADMIEVAENFINNAYDMGWTEKAEKAQDILKLKSIGYVGRKEYSLFTPLQWYKRLDKSKKSIWDNLGLKLLNISKNASELGDNRAAVSIDSAVATSAGREGYQSLWKFANLTDKWNKQWLQTIFDGVISSFEAEHFTEEELIAIWELSTKIFFVYDSADRYDTDNTLRKIYIADIKEGILLAANRLGYSNIKHKLNQIAQYEFGLERTSRENHSFIIPNRWFDCNDKNQIVDSFINDIESLSCQEANNKTIEQYKTNKNSFRWDFVVELIQKYITEDNRNIEECSIDMYNLLLQREGGYYWEFDGANRAFEAIFPYLDKEKIRGILDNLISNYFGLETSSVESKLFSINSDLENFSYCYYETLAIEESETALKLILEMHNIWLTGNGILPLKTYYTMKETNDMPENWLDFCNKLNEKLIKRGYEKV